MAVIMGIIASCQQADAACNLIPRAATTFRAALGSTNRPFAAPGEFLELKLRPAAGLCDAASPGFDAGLTDRVTVLFTPPNGPANAVVLSTDCSFFTAPVESACAAALGGGGSTATCIAVNPSTDVKFISGLVGETRLQLRFPLVDVAAGTCSGGANSGRTCRNDASCGGGTCTGLTGNDHTLSGPAKIVVTDAASPLACGLATARCASSGATPGLVACVDEFFELDGTCRKDPQLIDATFGGFTALPPPNNYQAMCIEPSPPCTGTATEARLTTDAAGNLLVPIDWRGILVRANQVPVPRLLRGSTPLEAFDGLPDPIRIPNGDFTGSFTPEGVKLPPIFEPQVDATAANETTFFGTADAPYTILRVARKSPLFSECAAGCSDGGNPCVGRPCTADAACPGSSCAATVCVGGGSAGQECVSDAGCPGGTCGTGPGLFDLSDRYAANVGPVVVTRFIADGPPGRVGVCDNGGSEGDVCSTDGQCSPERCVDYRIEAQDPVPLEGLSGTEQAFSFTVSEATVGRDLNGDGDASDAVLLFRNRATGQALPIGTGGAVGRAIARVSQPPFSFPALATEDDVVAYLEPETFAGYQDLNANGDIFETILRIIRRSSSTAATSLLPGSNLAVNAAPLINGKSIEISNGLVFYRISEAANAPQVTTRATIADDGSESPDGGGIPFSTNPFSFSGDGQLVAFPSSSSNLISPLTDTNGAYDIFIRDRRLQTTALASLTSSGNQLSSVAVGGSLSRDGEFVAFASPDPNVIGAGADTNGAYDVFVRHLSSGQTVRVSVSSAGLQADGNSGYPMLSANGRYVIFVSYATNLVSGDTNTCGPYVTPGACPDIFLHDRDFDGNGIFDEAGGGKTLTERVTVSSSGVQHNSLNLYPAIGNAVSADGRFIVFSSDDPDLLPAGEDTNGTTDALVRDRSEQRTFRVSQPDPGFSDGNFATVDAISEDGRYVAFTANSGLTAESTGLHVYLRDLSSGSLEIASRSVDGTPAGSSQAGRLSEDSRFVVFFSQDSNAVPGGNASCNGCVDVFVRDRLTSQTRRVSVSTAGAEADGGSHFADISASGSEVAFLSSATNLLGPGADQNASWDVFVRGADGSSLASDLTGDGDLDDTILEVADTTTGPPATRTTLCPSDIVAVAQGAAAFLRSEGSGLATNVACAGPSLTGPDLNGDGDVADEIVHFWSQATGVQNLRCAATAVSLSSSHVAALVSEAAEPASPSLNGDADATDTVVKVRAVGGAAPSSCSAASWVSTQQAADAAEINGSTVALITPESAQGTMSTTTGGTRDGDSSDRVVQLFNAYTSALIPVRDGQSRMQPAEEFVLDSEVVAFRSHEADLCGVPVTTTTCGGGSLPGGCALATCDLNGDGDCCDDVLQTFDFGRPGGSCNVASPPADCLRNSALAVTPCRLEACDPRKPYRVSGATVKFLTFEQQQNCSGGPDCYANARDLNGDGDANDLILQTFNARSGEKRVIATIDQSAGSQADPLEGDTLDPDSTGTVVAISKGMCVETLSGLPSCPGTPCPAGAFCESGACKRDQGVCVTNADCPGDAGGSVICRQDPIVPASADSDGDGVADPLDNCPNDANPGQEDADGDDVGDACDAQTCGDGTLQLDEACDDGNTVGGDGCEENCTVSAVGSGCASIGNAKLKLTKLGGTASDEGVTFSGKIQFGPGQPSGFNPLNSIGRGAQLLIEDLGNGNASVYELSHRTKPVPPGAKGTVCSSKKKDGWTVNKAQTTYVYTNATNALSNASCGAGTAKGLKTFKLNDKRAANAPSIDVTIRAAKASIVAPVGPLRATVVLSAIPADGLTGACGQVSFASCTLNAAGSTLSCE